MHKLMIKTHNTTGLKYLCYTQSDGGAYARYYGSGTRWKRHLSKHGNDISTTIIFQTEDYDQFKSIALEKSIEFDIVNSSEWANLRNEEGTGGNTFSNRIWITDGSVDRGVFASDPIPDGWKRGRSKCVFNDSTKQKEFSSKINRENNSSSMKKAWADGKFDKRDHSKCGSKGDNNPSKRPEVREKISKSHLEYHKRSKCAIKST